MKMKFMIAQTFPLKQLVKMFRSSELKVVPIVSGSGEVGVPAEYMLYGGAINRYSQALSVLRDVCDEITRRRRSGIVMPRLVVSVDNVDSLLLRSPDGEVARLLDILSAEGEECGVELVA